jgi:hypothetical protein
MLSTPFLILQFLTAGTGLSLALAGVADGTGNWAKMAAYDLEKISYKSTLCMNDGKMTWTTCLSWKKGRRKFKPYKHTQMNGRLCTYSLHHHFHVFYHSRV